MLDICVPWNLLFHFFMAVSKSTFFVSLGTYGVCPCRSVVRACAV